MEKLELLKSISFGKRVAEEEVDELQNYFVQTEQWRNVVEGNTDVIYGPKGSGKSAIYYLVLSQADDLNSRGVLAIPAENMRGQPVFKDLVSDPPTSEDEFRFLWKLYLLSLLGRKLREIGDGSSAGGKVISYLENAELLQPERSLRSILRSVVDYGRKMLQAESVEGGLKIDSNTGLPAGLSGKITFREPSHTNSVNGFISVDELLEAANDAFWGRNHHAWIMIDRLDVAFAESKPLEQNALRALFRVYLDLIQHSNLHLKIFIRNDIWREIVKTGFREASHITRSDTIEWGSKSLLNLVVRRILKSNDVCEAFGIDASNILADQQRQEEFFYTIFPSQIDAGERQSSTFDWLMSRTRDAYATAPRELIHLLQTWRDEQIKKLEMGGGEPEGNQLFQSGTVRDALKKVSQVRLEQTIYAEYPQYKDWIERLRDQKTEQTMSSLAKIWGKSNEEVEAVISGLLEIGFFERRTRTVKGHKGSLYTYWVPFLYRNALNLSQGTVDLIG